MLFMRAYAAELSISATTDTDRLAIDSTLTVTYKATFPPAYEPETAAFIAALSKQDAYGVFSFVDSKISQKGPPLIIQVRLSPLATGRLVFVSPPLVVSSGNERHLLFAEPFSVWCEGAASAPLVQPLTVPNPEKAVILNDVNREKSFEDPAMLALQQERNETLAVERGAVWTTVTLSLFAVAAAFIVLWCLIEYELARRGRPKPEAPFNIHSEYEALEKLEAPLEERLMQLSRLIRRWLSTLLRQDVRGKNSRELVAIMEGVQNVPTQVRLALQDVLERLDALEFTGGQPSAQEWARCLSLLKSAVGEAQ